LFAASSFGRTAKGCRVLLRAPRGRRGASRTKVDRNYSDLLSDLLLDTAAIRVRPLAAEAVLLPGVDAYPTRPRRYAPLCRCLHRTIQREAVPGDVKPGVTSSRSRFAVQQTTAFGRPQVERTPTPVLNSRMQPSGKPWSVPSWRTAWR